MATQPKTLLEALTESLSFDSSGRLNSSFGQWTEQNIYEVFKRMVLTDARIRGAINIRRSKALSYDWDIPAVGDGDSLAQDVYDMLDRFEIVGKLADVWNAIPFGYALNEITWEIVDGKFAPKAIHAVDNVFVELRVNGPVIKAPGREDIDTSATPYKYILTTYDGMFGSPQGLPVLAVCYWPWIFKRQGNRFWARMLEKFGVPSLAALFDSEDPIEKTTPDTITVSERAQALLVELRRMEGGGNIALPNISDLRVINASGKGDDYDAFLNRMDNEISIGFLGNTMTMDSQSRGSQALGTVHQEITEQVAKGDTNLLKKFVNTLIRWYVDLNYGVDVEAPRIAWDLDGETSWDVVKDVWDRGLPLSRKALYYKIRGYEPEDDSDAVVKPEFVSDSGEVGLSRPFALLPGRGRTRPRH